MTASTMKKGLQRLAGCLFAAALVLGVCMPQPALAYFSKPAVNVYFGASSISLTSGSSGTVAVSVDMWSEQQLPGCGMSVCPQECGSLSTPSGVQGGCLSADGWCTCAGTSYITAYTQLSASSSNPSVARASISGGALYIDAYSAGSATITVYSTLSKHANGAASMTVYVSDPAPAPSGGSSSGGGASSGGGSGWSGGSSAPAASGSGSSGGAVSVSSVGSGTSATAAAAQVAASAEGGEQEAVEMETEDGTKMVVVKAGDSEEAEKALREIAGTEGTVTFWSGGTLDSPSISWTFKGTDLSADADLALDTSVSVSSKGTGDVSKLLDSVDKSIVMNFGHTGDLPAPAEVYVRASGVYDDGAELGLYVYNEDEKRFELQESDVKVSDGYATFTMGHCSTWALSDEDLTALELPQEKAGSQEQQGDAVDASQVDVHAQDGTAFLVGAGIAVAAVVALAAGVVVAKRRKAAAAQGVDEGDAAGDVADDAGADDAAADGADEPAEGDAAAGDAAEEADGEGGAR